MSVHFVITSESVEFLQYPSFKTIFDPEHEFADDGHTLHVSSDIFSEYLPSGQD